jgi:hypothetical protein
VPAAIVQTLGYPAEVVALLRHRNVFAEVLFPAKELAFPYPEGQRMLRHLCTAVPDGVSKLLWGSDSPYSLTSWCTCVQPAGIQGPGDGVSCPRHDVAVLV